ncbi:hypothetical protein [Roseicyclus mahoneyensis]|uniref:Arginine transporter n=1 Tax=Roseicyclus mahoneyensis TaxID=164332 RepID=A0A316GJF9_9RHOB|nr:hypothetical protein [Roseicyclus mahoneyensis]PWK60921.1 hypothetical protein C7455_103119 [Roseicyclus mahoneyensis]
MTRRFLIVPALALALAAAVAPVPANANPIERACQQSNRSAATPALCDCIGRAAQQTLTNRQMRDGARFFQDPQRAQDVRQSDRRTDEELWRAWRNFGQTAEALCR